jgi:uncharacterized protein
MSRKEKKSDHFEALLRSYANHPMFSHLDEIKVNSTAMDGDSILHKAVSSKDVEAVRILLNHGADPNILGDMGCTPLHEAVELAQLEIVETLLKAGASPLVLSEFKQSPIDIACLQPDPQMADLIRRYI